VKSIGLFLSAKFIMVFLLEYVWVPAHLEHPTHDEMKSFYAM
nr:hypothetical protein [Tanacetum cinerariifolium]